MNDDRPLIRPACEADCERLGEIKFNYVQQLYGGITPRQVLEDISQERCVERVRDLVRNDRLRVDVIEQQGTICGFAAYGPDPDAPDWGLLYDTLYLTQTSMDLHHTLLKHMVDQLKDMGLAQVHLWVLRNHYRARYLYEMFGFRTDGTQLKHTVEQSEYRLIRYQYPTI